MLERNRSFRFYQPELGYDLPHDPFKAIIAPRPIGWISTVDEHGRQNLAPYSYFNAVSTRPPAVMFSSEGVKDSVRNDVDTGVRLQSSNRRARRGDEPELRERAARGQRVRAGQTRHHALPAGAAAARRRNAGGARVQSA